MYNLLRPDDLDPWPIPITPGGPIASLCHVGHLSEVDEVLAMVAPGQVGAYCPGDRRMGKTSLINLVEAVLMRDDDIRVLRLTAEAEGFGDRVAVAVRSATWLARERDRRTVDVDVSARGVRVRRDGRRRERSSLPTDLFAELAHVVAPRRLVVLIDEVAVLVAQMEKAEAGSGVGLLRSFRAARQDLADNLAFVLSGSIGLHHVLPTRQPINDLKTVRIGPLAQVDAAFLARCLLLGGGIETAQATNDEAVAQAIAAASEGIPFVVHHIADRLARRGAPTTVTDVEDALANLLADADDPLDLSHYIDRIPSYYGQGAPLAFAVLDVHAVSSSPLSFDETQQGVQMATSETPDRARLVQVLSDLVLDGYLERREGKERFSWNLLQRFWVGVRRLEQGP